MKLTNSLFAKVTALFLLVLTLLGTVGATAVIVADANLGVYTGEYAQNRQEILRSALRSAADEVMLNYANGNDLDLLYADASFYYTVTDEHGETLIGNFNGEGYAFSESVTRTFYWEQLPLSYGGETEATEAAAYTEVTEGTPAATAAAEFPPQLYAYGSEIATSAYDETHTEPAEITLYRLCATLYAKKVIPAEASDRYALVSSLLDMAYRFRYSSIAFAALGVLLFLALLIFLYCSAGHRRGEDEPRPNIIDRIPFDLYTVLVGGIATLFIALTNELFYAFSAYDAVCAAILCLLGVGLFLLFLGYTMSFATRVKVGGLFKNTLIWRVLSLFGRAVKAIFSLLGGIPIVWKTALLLIGCFALEFIFILITWNDPGSLLVNWFFFRVILFFVILWAALALRRLQKCGESIAAGKLDEKVDTRNMVGDFKRFGETLGNIGDGLSRAVEERTRSERMKTELITNVSHDIKTPLTSIINYVDLIKKEEPESETMRQYLDILDRQSARLKKLIEDLVEASKASTGNLSVELAPCEVGILLEQTLGEYNERLEASGLTPVLTLPETPVMIFADGRRMWRVFDNLMNNVCKYAQSGTRVYIELTVLGSRAVVTFKNISKEPLPMSGEELTERFVRGDSSRNTEGSGLGLSIAQSLTELQGGRLAITTDGDLFKAVVSFDVYNG